MTKVFIDTSVFFAASLSSTGASREIIRLAIRGEITLVASQLVLEEIERNLAKKAPEVLSTFRQFLAVIPLELSHSTKKEVEQAAKYTEVKDAAIVAAAKRAEVDYLVSLDRHHLVGVAEVARGSGLTIVLPKELLNEIRGQG